MQVRDLIEQLQKFDPSCEVEMESMATLECEDIATIDRIEMDSGRFRVLIIIG